MEMKQKRRTVNWLFGVCSIPFAASIHLGGQASFAYQVTSDGKGVEKIMIVLASGSSNYSPFLSYRQRPSLRARAIMTYSGHMHNRSHVLGMHKPQIGL
jgi:hypothetical protein